MLSSKSSETLDSENINFNGFLISDLPRVPNVDLNSVFTFLLAGFLPNDLDVITNGDECRLTCLLVDLIFNVFLDIKTYLLIFTF